MFQGCYERDSLLCKLKDEVVGNLFISITIDNQFLLGTLMSESKGRKMTGVSAKRSQKDLAFRKELQEAGKVVSVIDKRFTLSETVEALRYLEEGHSRGKVVITI